MISRPSWEIRKSGDIMIEFVERQITIQDEISISCDRCGEKEDFDTMGTISLRHEFGYGSERDGDYLEADICEKCFFEMMEKFGVRYRIYKNGIVNDNVVS